MRISIAAAALLVWLAGGMLQAGEGKSLRPGTEVFAVDPTLVLEISYRTGDQRLLAQRWQIGEPFTLTFWEKNQTQPVSCPAGPNFDPVLKQLTSLKLRRTLDAREREEYSRKKPLSAWAELVIRDNSVLEPFRAHILPLVESAAEALVHFHGVTYLVEFDPRVFSLISGGCRALGAPGGAKKSQPQEKPWLKTSHPVEVPVPG